MREASTAQAGGWSPPPLTSCPPEAKSLFLGRDHAAFDGKHRHTGVWRAVTMQREKPNQLSKNWKRDSLSGPQVRQEDKGYFLESMNS